MAPLMLEYFLKVEITDFIPNIWILSDNLDFDPCLQYVQYSIEALRRKRSDEYIDFYFLIGVLRTRNKQFFDLHRISDREKNTILQYIKK